jgi:hypothetical protein
MATKTESNQIDWDDKDQVRELHDSIVKFVQGDPFESTPNLLARSFCMLARHGASWPKMAERKWLGVIRDLIFTGRLITDGDNLVGPAPIVEPEPQVEQLQLTWGED